MSSQTPRFAEALRFWHLLGWINFGGPAGQIALMQQELVDRRRWIAREDFLAGLNFCMLLPGPEAQQLATYVGWRMHGWRGALAAGGLFVLPGALVLAVLSYIAAAHGDVVWVRGLFDGLKPIVLAIVLGAIWRLMRKTLTGARAMILAVAAFVAMALVDLPFPLVIAAAGLFGAWTVREKSQEKLRLPPGTGGRVLRLTAIFVALWAVAVLPILWAFDAPVFRQIAGLFTGAAFVTFGGAYAVLPYIAERAVQDYGWLSAADMVNGLALAETTPGPLIMVLQYVGFFAAWNAPGELSPLAAGLLGAGLTTYVTFLPSFFFILVGGPMMDALRAWPKAQGALAAITAAVVGVMMTLALFFGQAVLWPSGGFDAAALVLAAVGLGLLVWRNWSIFWLIGLGAAYGLARVGIEYLQAL